MRIRHALRRGAVTLLCVTPLGFYAIHVLRSTSDGAGVPPLATHALPVREQIQYDARVVERLPAGSYTYLLIERTNGVRGWVVTLSSSDAVRSRAGRVRITALGFAERFASKRLSRSFERLHFAVVRPA